MASSVWMFVSGLIGLCLVAACLGQQLVLTHAPSYVKVQQQKEPLAVSDVPEVISNTLGLSDTQKPQWKGLQSGSLFKRPKANVLLTVVTSQSGNLQAQNLSSFPVDSDVPLLDMNPLMNLIQSSFLDYEPVLLDLMTDTNMFDVNTPNDIFHKLPKSVRSLADRLLDSDSVLSRVDAGSLNRSDVPDLTLLTELQMIDHVLKTLHGSDALLSGKTPDLFSFTITGLKSIVDAHGPESDQMKDAHTMVSKFIDTMTAEFRKLYKDNVIVEVLVVPVPERGLVRKSRSLLQATPAPSTMSMELKYNLGWDYDKDFAAMCNIVLWLCVALIITVFVISYGMWNIDPGRDSIIYRMTSQRLKKD